MRSRTAPATRRSSEDPFGVVFLPTGRYLFVELLVTVFPMRSRKLVLALAAMAAAAGVVASVGWADATPRSGALHVTKECSEYGGAVGSFCTITSSNIPEIKVGSRVVYASAPGDPTPGTLDSDLVIDGPGANTALGHVVLDLSTLSGVVTFSGGTGVFSHFHAGPIAVACPAFPDCYWDGPYSFSPPAKTGGER
jgi:hypothetical protein